jgi:sec-independent protein translocase protein TatA
MFGTLGVTEVIVIFIVALVLFGPKKLPELGKTIGKALTEFRRASNDLKSTFEREMHNLERETDAANLAAEINTAQVWNHATHQDPTATDSGWNPQVHESSVQQSTLPEPLQEPSVGALATPGAESTGTAEAQEVHPTPSGHTPAPSGHTPEGTVARNGSAHHEAPVETATAVETGDPNKPAPEKTQHS